ncbi:MAG: Maf family protein [Planctomycetes bacterium]|nr:Maf family protein [Planctomycetota bacterium]
MVDLYLASTSPRRRALLRAAGIAFELCEPGEEEVVGERGTPAELAVARAERKARGAVVPEGDRGMGPVLGVDTVVDLEGRELGKACDRAAARATLLALAGRSHRVHTGHCLIRSGGDVVSELCTAVVTCRVPTDAELERYLDSLEWQGKAGAYGIQDASQAFLTLSAGAFDTVVGLHVAAVQRLLAAGPRP